MSIGRYAQLEWDPRFNHVRDACALSQSGPHVVLVSCMGTISFNLEDTESIAAFTKQMTMAIELLNKTKREYEEAGK